MTGLFTLLTVVYFVMVCIALVLVVEQVRDTAWTMSWIMAIVMVPVAGILLFVLVGYRPRRKRIIAPPSIRHTGHDPFITLLENNSGAELAVHNEVEVLHNGEQTFSSIAEAILAARSSIHVEYYIFCEDVVGNRIAGLLREQAAAGIEVRLIYDAVGSWKLTRQFLAGLRASGIEVGCFEPIVFPWFTHRVNYRNHRKIVVVDGKVAFTGGINIAERYLKGDTMGLWHDVNLRIEGDAVADLQRLFLLDWKKVSGRALDDDRYFPCPVARRTAPMQIVWSGVSSAWSAISQAFFAAITGANERVVISTPYFIPSPALLEALNVAALKGVDVKLIIPSTSDAVLVGWATRSFVGGLLSAGVKVYFYTAGFLHSKLLVIDDRIASVGSANMDIRSLEDNFEVSAFIYDPPIIREVTATLDDYIAHSRRVSLDEWERRSRLSRVIEAFARLFSPVL